jgi:putative ABC transport system permease protein
LSDRRRELVVRAALGSGQTRLIRQVLTESLMLSLIGTASGICIAAAGVRYFRVLSPIELPPHAGVVGIDPPVLLFAAILSLATTLLFGLIPAVQVSRVDLSHSLNTAGRGFFGTASRQRTAQTVLAAEMALSFVLLVGAGLLMTSVLRMGSEPLGFDSEGVFRFGITLPTPRYADQAQRTRFYDELLTRLENLPGVETVAFGQFPPFNGGGEGQLEIQGRTTAGTPVSDVDDGTVSPRYFELLRTPLLRGRPFDARDRLESPRVTIVSQAIVDEYFPNREPLGQQIRVFDGETRSPWMMIVGVVGTQKHIVNDSSWRDTPMVYQPIAQQPYPQISVGLRASGDPALLGRELQKQVSALDPSVQVEEGELLAARLEKMLAYPRFRAMLLACFAAGALLLASVGLHGVLLQLVAQRTPEFGVRRAVGAQTWDLVWLVARQGGIPVFVGLSLGLGFSLAFSRLLASLLYKIQPADPRLLGAVSMILMVVSALAIALPAHRAASVDPMVALRDE